MFKEFLEVFKDTFKIPKITVKENFSDDISLNTKNFYTWDNSNYREFMNLILRSLEPYHMKRDQILFRELQEIETVIFVTKGNVDVGFEINRKEKMVLRFSNRIIIGAYNCAENKKTLFLYKCKTDVFGL